MGINGDETRLLRIARPLYPNRRHLKNDIIVCNSQNLNLV